MKRSLQIIDSNIILGYINILPMEVRDLESYSIDTGFMKFFLSRW